jgi:hypothetical protein
VGIAALVLPMAQVAQAATVCGSWENESTPNPGDSGNTLYSVATSNGQEAWAVGFLNKSGPVLPLALRWNGKEGSRGWQTEPVPFSGGQGLLNDVSIAPVGDVWAVGAAWALQRSEMPLVMRWRNGARDFESGSTFPSRSVTSGAFNGVAALAEDDVWMVGIAYPQYTVNHGYGKFPLASHWDGSQLREVAMPYSLNRNYALQAVAGADANDVWAVGTYYDGTGSHAVTYHWDGKSWTAITNPVESLTGSSLTDVVALATNDVWAVGSSGFSNNLRGSTSALYLHWDGMQWLQAKAPFAGAIPGAVAAVASDDVWATSATEYAHFDGTTWSTVVAPLGANGASRGGLAVLGTCDVIAVGGQSSGALAITLAERLRVSTPFPPTSPIPAPPAAPSLTVLGQTASTVELAWTAAGVGFAGVLVERCQGTADACDMTRAGYQPVAKLSLAVTSYDALALRPSVTYSFRVSAFTGDGTVVSSNAVMVTTAAAPVDHDGNAYPTPIPPTASSLTVLGRSSTTVQLGWTPSGADTIGYLVQRCQGTSCEAFAQSVYETLAKLGHDTTRYEDADLVPSTTYNYRLVTVAKGEAEVTSNSVVVTTMVACPRSLGSCALPHPGSDEVASQRPYATSARPRTH